ncbi:MAG: two-component sensor histidine kinase [Glaciihabitans sp.]|nr:two-component sensor histidine kinase [Glaciihabitans sp.]
MLLGILGGFGAFLLAFSTSVPEPDASVDEAGLFALRLVVDVVLGVVAITIYPLRRRKPLLVTCTILLLSALSSLAVGVGILAVISIATRRRPREIVLVTALFLGSGFVDITLRPATNEEPLWQLALVGVGSATVLVLIGLYIGGRRQLLASLRRQAELSQREQSARELAAKADERNRIAREMHDALAHRLSLVALHAGALSHRTDLSAEQTAATASTIRENAHLALAELREVLGIMRDHGVKPTSPGADPGTVDEVNTVTTDGGAASSITPSSVRPQPTLAQLDELIDSATTAGNPVQLIMSPAVAGRLPTLPDGAGRHLYRVAQEALTNARKHAPGQPVTVELTQTPGAHLVLTVTSDLVPPEERGRQNADAIPSGFGLAGLDERLRLAGGDFDIIPNDNGRFVVHAALPWPT